MWALSDEPEIGLWPRLPLECPRIFRHAADDDGVWTALLDENFNDCTVSNGNFQLVDSDNGLRLSGDKDDSFTPRRINSIDQQILFDPSELFEGSENISNKDDDLPGLQLQSDSSDDEDELETTPCLGEATEYDEDHSALWCTAAYNAISIGALGEGETELYDSGATRHMCPIRLVPRDSPESVDRRRRSTTDRRRSTTSDRRSTTTDRRPTTTMGDGRRRSRTIEDDRPRRA